MPRYPTKSLPLLGDLIEDFPKSETLPTNGQAVLLLANYTRNKGLTVLEASQEVTKKLFEIWNNKSGQPHKLILTGSCSQRLVRYYKRLDKINKLFSSRKKTEFISLMNKICDLNQYNYYDRNKQKAPVKRPPTPPPLPEKRVRKPTKNDQFLETFTSDEDDEEDGQLMQTVDDSNFKPVIQSYPKKRINYITDEMCESIIKSKMSAKRAFMKCKQEILASGANIDDYILSIQTVFFRLKRYKAKLSLESSSKESL